MDPHAPIHFAQTNAAIHYPLLLLLWYSGYQILGLVDQSVSQQNK